MTHRRQVTDCQRKRILRLHRRGYNGKVIARSVGLHSNTIYAVLKADRERLAEIEAQAQRSRPAIDTTEEDANKKEITNDPNHHNRGTG